MLTREMLLGAGGQFDQFVSKSSKPKHHHTISEADFGFEAASCSDRNFDVTVDDKSSDKSILEQWVRGPHRHEQYQREAEQESRMAVAK